MQRVRNILSTILAVPEETLDDNASPATIESWDSFNALMIVSELEREFSVSFSIEEITGVRNVRDIRAALTKHGVPLEE